MIATNADSDEMSHVAVFHLGLHCLIKAHLYGVKDGWLRMGLPPPPPLGNFADISYLVEN